ncbi:FAD/NAD(P)-binding domain-containing protein [Thozetella sp. PMI_491]|nr:FAD/NAD(P)-binding domain-containing protein [Thozetella sp. PMI_491]
MPYLSGLGLEDYPPKASLLEDLYKPLPQLNFEVDYQQMDLDEVGKAVVQELFSALQNGDQQRCESLFYQGQCYYRDSLALTYHKRGFEGAGSISRTLLKLSKARVVGDLAAVPGAQHFVVSPTLGWLDLGFTFKTRSPRATCGGNLKLLPQKAAGGVVEWKIWTMSTWLNGLDDFPEDESRLQVPTERKWKTQTEITTDVTIIGGGNSGLLLAARLKALGVDYLIIEKNDNNGDNWGNRYDCMRFHVPKGFCQTPYLPYPDDTPEELTRDNLSQQMRRFAEAFDLNVIHKSHVKATRRDEATKTWVLDVASSATVQTVQCKHLVLATGVASWTPYIPDIADQGVYSGIETHSHHYKSAKTLAESGAKARSVLVVGSANTAFDVIEDCYKAGLQTTMIQRSPTYLIPLEYHHDPRGLGIYDIVPSDIGDQIVFTGPIQVGGQLLAGVHASLSAKEPNRYDKLAAAGFQVIDSTKGDLMHNILERGGGHFVDMGMGVELLSTGKVGIKSGVVPIAFTRTGLMLSDGTTLDADAIVWCTGFSDTDIRYLMSDILGSGGEAVAEKMDAVWSLDREGETRGMFKRHEKVDNLWVMGFGAAAQRLQSKGVSMQIKAELEGILPEAYRDTPLATSTILEATEEPYQATAAGPLRKVLHTVPLVT